MHTYLTTALRCNVLESEFLLFARLHYMQAFSALNAHPKVDINSANDKINELYINALNMIPYLTDGLSAQDYIMQERLKLIEEYKKFVQNKQI